eukprot:624645-Rhodomonas_salina.3
MESVLLKGSFRKLKQHLNLLSSAIYIDVGIDPAQFENRSLEQTLEESQSLSVPDVFWDQDSQAMVAQVFGGDDSADSVTAVLTSVVYSAARDLQSAQVSVLPSGAKA